MSLYYNMYNQDIGQLEIQVGVHVSLLEHVWKGYRTT